MAQPPRTALLDRLAFGISAVSSPFLVLPLFLTLLAFRAAPSHALAVRWTALAVAGMVGVPLGYIVVEVRRGHLTDIHVKLREQRRGPFIAAIGGCAVAALLLLLDGAAPVLVLAALAAVANGLVFLAVTLRWKISMHPSILTACALMGGRLIAGPCYLVLLALPLVVWARVRRQRHTVAQGAAAIAASASITWAMTEVWLRRFATG